MSIANADSAFNDLLVTWLVAYIRSCSGGGGDLTKIIVFFVAQINKINNCYKQILFYTTFLPIYIKIAYLTKLFKHLSI
jgi:hypothetical protein